MAGRHLFRRGAKADLPTLAQGEPAIALDEKRLYFGTATGNVGIPKKEQEAWISPTLLNNWINYGVPYANAGYYKDDFGIVRLGGVIKSGTATAGTGLFFLPVGYRPSATRKFTVSSGNGTSDIFGSLNVQSDGAVVIASGASSLFSFDGVTFRAEG